MTFAETLQSIDEDYNQCSNLLRKIEIFSEASERELEINCQEAELKVIKESGTQSDLEYLYEAANEGYVVKAKNAIKKAIDVLITFIKTTFSKLRSAFASAKAKLTIKTIDDKCKNNPKLKNKKVNVPDYEKQDKMFKKGINEIDSKLSKAKVGKATDKDVEEAKELQKKYTAAKVAATVGTTAVLLGGSALVYNKFIKKADTVESESVDSVQDVPDFEEDMSSEESVKKNINIINALTHCKGAIVKERILAIKNSISGFFKGIRKGTMIVSENLEESVNEYEGVNNTDMYNEYYLDDLYDDIFSESVEDDDFDLDGFLESDDDLYEEKVDKEKVKKAAKIGLAIAAGVAAIGLLIKLIATLKKDRDVRKNKKYMDRLGAVQNILTDEKSDLTDTLKEVQKARHSTDDPEDQRTYSGAIKNMHKSYGEINKCLTAIAKIVEGGAVKKSEYKSIMKQCSKTLEKMNASVSTFESAEYDYDDFDVDEYLESVQDELLYDDVFSESDYDDLYEESEVVNFIKENKKMIAAIGGAIVLATATIVLIKKLKSKSKGNSEATKQLNKAESEVKKRKGILSKLLNKFKRGKATDGDVEEAKENIGFIKRVSTKVKSKLKKKNVDDDILDDILGESVAYGLIDVDEYLELTEDYDY